MRDSGTNVPESREHSTFSDGEDDLELDEMKKKQEIKEQLNPGNFTYGSHDRIAVDSTR